MSLKLVYKDIPPGMNENLDSFSLTNYNEPLSSISLDRLKQTSRTRYNYATFEHNRWKLDGTFKGLRGDDVLIWSTSLSAVSGERVYVSGSKLYLINGTGDASLASPPVLTKVWNGYYTTSGMSFTFDEETYCTHLRIKWYRDNTLLYDIDFYPDGPDYFCRQVVDLFNKVEITFYTLSKRNRFLKVIDILDGRSVEFTNAEISNINILEEMSLVSEDLPYNVLELGVLQKPEDADYVFQFKQEMDVFFKDALWGKFFVQKSERTGRNAYNVNLIDYKGLLDTSNFNGGIYENVTAQSIIDEILGTESNIPYVVDSVTANQVLSGYIPICTKREALLQVLLACVSVCDDSRRDYLEIFKLPNTSHTFDENRTFIGTGNNTNIDPVTAIKLTSHNYVLSSTQETVYSARLGLGTYRVEFSEPILANPDNIIVTGAAIANVNTNYCDITVLEVGTVEIQAYVYKDSTNILISQNTYVRTGTPTNEVSFDNATLVTDANANAVLFALNGFYFKTEEFEAKVAINDIDEKLGDNAIMSTDWSGNKSGRINRMEYSLRQKAIGRVKELVDG